MSLSKNRNITLNMALEVSEGSKVVSKFEKFDDELRNATEQLRYACSTLRSIHNKEPTGDFAVVFRRTVIHAKVYNRKILEIANVIVQGIKYCLEGFLDIDFEEFKENIVYFVEEAEGKEKEVEYTKKLHEEILTDFKREEDGVTKLLEGHKLDEKYNEEVNNKDDGGLATDISTFVGELQNSVTSFVDALIVIAGFFSTLESDLNILATSGGKHSPLIFKRFKNKVTGIIKSCDNYTASTPDLKTELQAISETSDEKNYIDRWIEREVRVGGRQVSLLDYGKETCPGNKKILRLLGN